MPVKEYWVSMKMLDFAVDGDQNDIINALIKTKKHKEQRM